MAHTVGLWVEKNPVPPPNRQALDWSVVFTVGGVCPIIPQDNIVVSNKHNWPEFYLGNPRACPGLEPPMVPTLLSLLTTLLTLPPPHLPGSGTAYVSKHWHHSCGKMDQAFCLHFCILQAGQWKCLKTRLHLRTKGSLSYNL